jgi:hypothetical protein
MFDLSGYTPKKVTDGFEAFKGKFNCAVNWARIEVYSGDDPALKDSESFRYELEVLDDPTYVGRRLWATFPLENNVKMEKLADIMFSLGLEFANKEKLEKIAEDFVTKIVAIKAWHFASKENPDEKIQMHQILGEAKGNTTPTGTPAF